MALFVGETEIKKICWGADTAKAIFLGDNPVYLIEESILTHSEYNKPSTGKWTYSYKLTGAQGEKNINGRLYNTILVRNTITSQFTHNNRIGARLSITVRSVNEVNTVTVKSDLVEVTAYGDPFIIDLIVKIPEDIVPEDDGYLTVTIDYDFLPYNGSTADFPCTIKSELIASYEIR